MAYTPSSSPPSSPSLCPVDSSPSASPILEPVITTDDSSAFRVITLGHPLAACVKADRTPPQYEKRYPDPPPVQLLSGRPTKKHRTLTPTVHEVRCISEDKDSVFSTASPHSSEHDREGSIWDEAITKVVDLGHGTVSLRQVSFLYRLPQSVSIFMLKREKLL
jgi:hypothetical protein